jgi:hypothetical protein
MVNRKLNIGSVAIAPGSVTNAPCGPFHGLGEIPIRLYLGLTPQASTPAPQANYVVAGFQSAEQT